MKGLVILMEYKHNGCEGCRWEYEDTDSEQCTGCIHNAIDKYLLNGFTRVHCDAPCGYKNEDGICTRGEMYLGEYGCQDDGE